MFDEMKSKAKKKVLEEIMALMDQDMMEPLKAKSPKFAKVDIKSNDPEMAEELKDKLMSASEEPDTEEKPKFESHESTNEEDEDLKRLKEMYEKLR